MAKDVLYTNGTIAVKEKYLLKEKIFRFCEMTAEDAFRSLLESGFGNGAEALSVYDYEALTAEEEKSLDDFIREYAPSEAEAEYLLAPRDFHNAKALLKAEYLGLDAEKMLAPEGRVPVSRISLCLKNGDFSPLGKELGGAMNEAASLFKEEEEDGEERKDVSGAAIGGIFEKALYRHLSAVCSKSGLLKKLLSAKADMTNVITALRSSEKEYAERMYVGGGRLTEKQLSKLFDKEGERAEHALDKTPYEAFYRKCFEAKKAGLPLTEGERILESFETDFFAAKKYELEKNQPFLYYVFRRRAETENIRIVFVCLLAGMREQEIKKRLRAF